MSSPQPPDGGQQEQQPQDSAEHGADQNGADSTQMISSRMDPQGEDPNGGATQVVRPVQPPQGQPPVPESTQVVPPSAQPSQPMYTQPGAGGPTGGGETQVVPQSMQPPPQPMYSQPGNQGQPGGGYPGQPGGFGVPQGQQPGGYGQPPQPPQQPPSPYGAQPPAPGQPSPYGQMQQGQGGGSKGLALTAGWIATILGGLGLIWAIVLLFGLASIAAAMKQINDLKAQGVQVPDISLPPFGLLVVVSVVALIAYIVLVTGGIMILMRRVAGSMMAAVGAGLLAVFDIIIFITIPQDIAFGGLGILIAIAVGVLAMLPGTRQYLAGSATPAPAAAGPYGQPRPGAYGQPQYPGAQPQQPPQPGYPPQQPGGYPQQPGGYPQQGGQPPQWGG